MNKKPKNEQKAKKPRGSTIEWLQKQRMREWEEISKWETEHFSGRVYKNKIYKKKEK